jgi:hypothetical protein
MIREFWDNVARKTRFGGLMVRSWKMLERENDRAEVAKIVIECDNTCRENQVF